jgi:hypothetical protein
MHPADEARGGKDARQHSLKRAWALRGSQHLVFPGGGKLPDRRQPRATRVINPGVDNGCLPAVLVKHRGRRW